MDEIEGTLSAAAKEDAASILFEGLMLVMKRKYRRRWRRACERLIAAPTERPSARAEAAPYIRGAFDLAEAVIRSRRDK